MSATLDDFQREYDPAGDLSFDGIKIRDGAAFSTSNDGTRITFGLCEGYRKKADGSLAWGYVRHHMGGDRAEGEVFSAFDSERSGFVDDHGALYGSIVRLLSEQWGIELRVMHMHPETDIVPEILARLKAGRRIERGECLGVAGCYGVGQHRHTHGELLSIGYRSELLDEILMAKYGNAAAREYTDAEVIAEYRRHAVFAGESDEAILHDYARERSDKGIAWCNRYRAVFGWDHYLQQPTTRYSTELLFEM